MPEKLTACMACVHLRKEEWCEAPHARAFDSLFAIYPYREQPRIIQVNHDGHCPHYEDKSPKENTNG